MLELTSCTLVRNRQEACSTKLNFLVERAGVPVLDDGATPMPTKNLSKPAPAETYVMAVLKRGEVCPWARGPVGPRRPMPVGPWARGLDRTSCY